MESPEGPSRTRAPLDRPNSPVARSPLAPHPASPSLHPRLPDGNSILTQGKQISNLFSSRASGSLTSWEAWGTSRGAALGITSHTDPRLRSLGRAGLGATGAMGLGCQLGEVRESHRKTRRGPIELGKGMGDSAGAISAQPGLRWPRGEVVRGVCGHGGAGRRVGSRTRQAVLARQEGLFRGLREGRRGEGVGVGRGREPEPYPPATPGALARLCPRGTSARAGVDGHLEPKTTRPCRRLRAAARPEPLAVSDSVARSHTVQAQHRREALRPRAAQRRSDKAGEGWLWGS